MPAADPVNPPFKTVATDFNLPVEVPEELIKTNPQFKMLLRKLEEQMTPSGLDYKTKKQLEAAKAEAKQASKKSLLWKAFTELMIMDDLLPEDCKEAVKKAAVLQSVPQQAEDAWVEAIRLKVQKLPNERRECISNAVNKRVKQVYSDTCSKLQVDSVDPSALSSAIQQKLNTNARLKEGIEEQKTYQLTRMAKIQEACRRCVELREAHTEKDQQLHRCEMNKYKALLKEMELLDSSAMLSMGDMQDKTYTGDVLAATEVINTKLKGIEKDVDQQITIKKHMLSLYENLGREGKDLAKQYARLKQLREHYKDAMSSNTS